MNLSVSQINYKPYTVFKSKQPAVVTKAPDNSWERTVPVYGDDVIRTNPAQLSILHMHDFHGQNIRMERAYSAIAQYDSNSLKNQNEIFDKDMPVDKLKLCSGDMFLGENRKDLEVVNEFLNISGVLANALGNHESDSPIDEFSDVVKHRKYRILGANIHPDKESKVNKILSNSFVVESNGNRYGIIGLVPSDMPNHLKRPKDVKEYNISDYSETEKDIKAEVEDLKRFGVNKIILLSHLGLEAEQHIAQNISDIDIILGGHTHNLMTKVEEGKNLFKSPKGEPVLIMQVGRDGEFIGMPNVKFNELGQMTEIQYNVLRTDDFSRSLVAKRDFEKILGTPEVVGKASYVEEPPKDIYANENPHCDFIVDCLRDELGVDIAVMNSANIRGRFYEGEIDTRDLKLISPFANKVAVIEVSEKELVDAIDDLIESSMESPVHRPGILQVSGLKYEFSSSEGEMTKLVYIDKNGKETEIDIDNPREDKIYTLAADDYCIQSKKSGLNLKHRLDNALQQYDCDKDEFVASYLRKHSGPVEIKSDGRIKVLK